MGDIKIIELKRSIFEDHHEDARCLRQQLKEQKTFLLNLMSSPGSGKTTTLLALADKLKDKVKMGVTYGRHVSFGCRYDKTGIKRVRHREYGFCGFGKCRESGMPGRI